MLHILFETFTSHGLLRMSASPGNYDEILLVTKNYHYFLFAQTSWGLLSNFNCLHSKYLNLDSEEL